LSPRKGSSAVLAAIPLALSLAFTGGCSGHEARTLRMRTALDAGEPRAAIKAVNEELAVDKDSDLPKKVEGDDALLVLDRGSIQQSLAQ